MLRYYMNYQFWGRMLLQRLKTEALSYRALLEATPVRRQLRNVHRPVSQYHADWRRSDCCSRGRTCEGRMSKGAEPPVKIPKRRPFFEPESGRRIRSRLVVSV